MTYYIRVYNNRNSKLLPSFDLFIYNDGDDEYIYAISSTILIDSYIIKKFLEAGNTKDYKYLIREYFEC